MLSTMTKRFKSEQVERLDGDVGAVQAPLEQRPAVLDAGDVDLAVDVPLGVVDDLVVVVAGQPDLGLECVAVDRSALFDVLADPGLEGGPPRVRHDHGAQLAAALEHPGDDRLVLAPGPGDLLGPHVLSSGACCGPCRR